MQVKKASSKIRHDSDWYCWAVCIYTSPSDFDKYHKSTAEACDYYAMKTEMDSAKYQGIFSEHSSPLPQKGTTAYAIDSIRKNKLATFLRCTGTNMQWQQVFFTWMTPACMGCQLPVYQALFTLRAR